MIQSGVRTYSDCYTGLVVVPQFPQTYVISTNRVFADRLGTHTAIMHSADVRPSACLTIAKPSSYDCRTDAVMQLSTRSEPARVRLLSQLGTAS
jgi:hypothetical protein